MKKTDAWWDWVFTPPEPPLTLEELLELERDEDDEEEEEA